MKYNHFLKVQALCRYGAEPDGGYGKFLKFLQSKNFEAGKWHGCHFPAAQGIEAE
jgi:hypothetical protein